MVDDEGKNELFHDPEDTKVLVCADVVEDALLERVKAFDGCRSGKTLGHEAAREVEILILAEHIVELPLGAE
jgi:hypothetical protein